jgi:hypothetical protein
MFYRFRRTARRKRRLPTGLLTVSHFWVIYPRYLFDAESLHKKLSTSLQKVKPRRGRKQGRLKHYDQSILEA